MVKKRITWDAELGKYTQSFPTKKEATNREKEYN